MRSAPWCLITVGDLKLYIPDAVISQDEGLHDTAILHFSRAGGPGKYRHIKDEPALVEWGPPSLRQKMYGYVDSITDGGHGADGAVVTVFGMTNVMRNGEPRQWVRTRPIDIARELTDRYKLGLVMDQYTQPLDQFFQTDESDWQALNRLAKTIGMAVTSHNGVVKVVDVRKEITRAKRRPLLRIEVGDGRAVPSKGFDFVDIDTNNPLGHDRFEFSGIDRLGQTFTITGGTGVSRHREESFQSLEEAMSAAARWEDRSRLRRNATVTVVGSARYKAGEVVYIREKDGSMDAWFITSARHTISDLGRRFYTSLVLQRPEGPDARTASAASPPPPPTLRKSQWTLARQYVEEL